MERNIDLWRETEREGNKFKTQNAKLEISATLSKYIENPMETVLKVVI